MEKLIEDFDKEFGFDKTSLRDIRIIDFIKKVRQDTLQSIIERLPEEEDISAHNDLITETKKTLEWYIKVGRNLYRKEIKDILNNLI